MENASLGGCLWHAVNVFFWAEPPNHWFFLSTAHNRSPFAVFGFFFLFFLFSVFFLFIFVWAFLGCLEVDPNWFAMILYLRRCHADSPRSRTDVVFFGGLFPTISHPAFLGFTGLPGRRVRSHNCGLCLSAFSPRNPTPRNFDSRFVFFGGSLIFKYIDLRTRDRVERHDWQHCSLVLQTYKFAAWQCDRAALSCSFAVFSCKLADLQLNVATVQLCLAVLQFCLQLCSLMWQQCSFVLQLCSFALQLNNCIRLWSCTLISMRLTASLAALSPSIMWR